MNIKRFTLMTSLAVALALGALGCNSPEAPTAPYTPPEPPPPPSVVPAVGVKVSPQSIVFAAIGEFRQLAATVAPLNATDQAVRWESSDTTVATVDATGRVTARAAGLGVFVTAFTHDGGHQASVNVSVDP